MRRDRCVEQAAAAAGLTSPARNSGSAAGARPIRRVIASCARPRSASSCASNLCAIGRSGFEFQRPPKRRFGLLEILARARFGGTSPSRDASGQGAPMPARTGILLDASHIEIPRHAPLPRFVTELVAAQEVFVGRGACRHVARAHHLLVADGQRQRPVTRSGAASARPARRTRRRPGLARCSTTARRRSRRRSPAS